LDFAFGESEVTVAGAQTFNLTPDAFYAERDARSALDHPLLQLPLRRVAIVVPAGTAASKIGIETALFWSASIIRRMGRPFSHIIIVASSDFRQSIAEGRVAAGRTVEEYIDEELRSADPFGRIEWRSSAGSADLIDANAVLWLGTVPVGAPHVPTTAINAHGWIALVQQPPLTELALGPTDFDAAHAAIIMAACIGTARIFASSFSAIDAPQQLAYALDAGVASVEPSTCSSWLSAGSTLRNPIPWKGATGSEPKLSQLLLVSAGGIGSNVARLLAESYVHFGTAHVIDPDRFELSNLNRTIGVGLASVGVSKASPAAEWLKMSADEASGGQLTYERWVTSDRAEAFRNSDTAVVVGVDQVSTRLRIASDWPWALVNGATAANTFTSSVHIRSGGGCVGCWYGQADSPFAATRTPMACVAGVAPGRMIVRQAAAYPFVSIAAAAQMVAMLIRHAHQPHAWAQLAGTVISMGLRKPELVQVRKMAPSDRCLLLCAVEYVQGALGRTEVGSDNHVPE
jgi:hypothetical protein